jgi:hypothetical protein
MSKTFAKRKEDGFVFYNKQIQLIVFFEGLKGRYPCNFYVNANNKVELVQVLSSLPRVEVHFP